MQTNIESESFAGSYLNRKDFEDMKRNILVVVTLIGLGVMSAVAGMNNPVVCGQEM
jgi:hypothetical protein